MLTRRTHIKSAEFKSRAPRSEAFATYQQWEGMQVDPDTGEIMGEVLCQ